MITTTVPATRPSPQRVSGAGIVVIALALSLSACGLLPNFGDASEPIRDEQGQVIETNPATDVFAIQVGDCLNDADVTVEVQTIPTVPCADPHDSEIYAAFILGDDVYPGADAVIAEAEADCLTAFERFVGVDYLDSIYDFSYYYPTEQSWSNGDREVLCVIYDPAGPVTGTLSGILG